jgi:hypothetical protein
VEVQEFNQKTPALVVIFRHGLTSEPSLESFDWMSNRVLENTASNIFCITATLLEQQLLLRLLMQNSERLVSSYNPARLDPTEWPFALSFLIPVGRGTWAHSTTMMGVWSAESQLKINVHVAASFVIAVQVRVPKH